VLAFPALGSNLAAEAPVLISRVLHDRGGIERQLHPAMTRSPAQFRTEFVAALMA